VVKKIRLVEVFSGNLVELSSVQFQPSKLRATQLLKTRIPIVARGLPVAVLILFAAASISLAGSLGDWRKQLALAQTDEDADATIELARRIVMADPHDGAAWLALEQGQVKNEDYARALATLSAWEKAGKTQPAQINNLRGDIYLATEEYSKAEAAWRAAITAQPSNYVILSKLADLLETEERWPEVLAFRTRAAAAKPAAALLAAKAGAELHMHQWDAASKTIDKANKLDATDPTVQQWLPRLELLAGSLSKIEALDKEIAASPKAATPLLDQGIIFIQINQPSLALSNAKRALIVDPGSVRARIQAGDAELALNLPNRAAKFRVSHDLPHGDDGRVDPDILAQLQTRDDAVKQNPGKAVPLAARSKTLRILNQYVLALDDAEAALKADPNSPDAEFEMGHDLDALGRSGEALPHIIRATELRPKDPVAWYYRGIIEANRADFTAAVVSQTKSLDIHKSQVALEARLNCELRLGLADQAAADQKRLNQIRPGDPQ
jgi:tetratricopeptide (TPR) repeat protein